MKCHAIRRSGGLTLAGSNSWTPLRSQRHISATFTPTLNSPQWKCLRFLHILFRAKTHPVFYIMRESSVLSTGWTYKCCKDEIQLRLSVWFRKCILFKEQTYYKQGFLWLKTPLVKCHLNRSFPFFFRVMCTDTPICANNDSVTS